MPIDEDTMIRRRPPLPPDADEIIRGEYTGWVPLIKPGESLEEAKAREEKLDSDSLGNFCPKCRYGFLGTN
jgi:hypothetical protein